MGKRKRFVIRYVYPATSDGLPVGAVYVLKCSWGKDVWSYTKDIHEATTFLRAKADSLARKRSWRDAEVLPAPETC